MKKIVVTIGTRPEAIKMSPLIVELRNNKNLQTIVINSGQHREMTQQVLRQFGIEEDFNLDIMRDKQDLFDITSRILQKMRPILTEIKPDYLCVHGDTQTALASALAASYLKIPVAHIEAGLRSHDLSSPWPEEMNRRMIDHMSHIMYAPTSENHLNLRNEGIPEEKIIVTGNTVIDAMILMLELLETNEEKKKDIKTRLPAEIIEALSEASLKERLVLVTVHRRESFGEPLREICQGIAELAKKYPYLIFVMPVHPNPQVRDTVYASLSGYKNIILTTPMDYESFVFILSNSFIILSDSGGIQEEASFLGKPVLLLRENSERPEAIKNGPVRLVGSRQNKIIESVENLISDESFYQDISKPSFVFGRGNAKSIIASHLASL